MERGYAKIVAAELAKQGVFVSEQMVYHCHAGRVQNLYIERELLKLKLRQADLKMQVIQLRIEFDEKEQRIAKCT